MHWNLPSNPVELEQREGRINRFKCLAIRGNVARKYGNIPFTADVWQEMFDAAAYYCKSLPIPAEAEISNCWKH